MAGKPRTTHALWYPARVTPAQTARVVWTVISIFVVQSVVFGLSVLPAFLFWTWMLSWALPEVPRLPLLRPAIVAMTLVPAYLVFAVSLVALSAASTRLFGWRTPPEGAWKLRDLEWPLLNWSRYMISTHVVRVLVGTLFRASPIWTMYMRWNGATIGRGVYINSLSISDHNMLEFGDGVVIGESVHLSGHTVEGGMVKTGRVRLARFVTVGLGSMIGIGVEAGEKCQIGALSVVPKYSKLEGGAIYAGVPARRIEKGARAPQSATETG
jgi:acetyltransferase-like isoleucine patch superfamily enzyme